MNVNEYPPLTSAEEQEIRSYIGGATSRLAAGLWGRTGLARTLATIEELRDAVERPAPLDGGFVRCPLCGDPERPADIIGGVCLTCADGIAFAQNARRGAIVIAPHPAPE